MNNNLGIMRLLAAFGVLFGHSFNLALGKGGHPGPVSTVIDGVTPYSIGFPGVCVFVFFTISGYLVTQSYVVRANVVDFIESRLLRIYPAAIVAIGFSAYVVGGVFSSLDLWEYLSHEEVGSFFLKNIWLWNIQFHLPGVFEDNPKAGSVNGSLWTLPIEIRMYLTVLLMGSLLILRKVGLFNLFVLLSGLTYILVPEVRLLLERTHYIYLILAFGVGSFLAMNRCWLPLKVRYGLFSLPVLVIAWGTQWYDYAAAFWLAYMVLAVGFTPKVKALDANRFGDFSYGVYLYAFPVQQSLVQVFDMRSPWLLVASASAVTFLLACASWFFIEKPMLAKKGMTRRWLARQSWYGVR